MLARSSGANILVERGHIQDSGTSYCSLMSDETPRTTINVLFAADDGTWIHGGQVRRLAGILVDVRGTTANPTHSVFVRGRLSSPQPGLCLPHSVLRTTRLPIVDKHGQAGSSQALARGPVGQWRQYVPP
jgi:hypothetical protein